MWEPREAGPIIQAAEKAAGAGNYASAEKLLRDAARQQEANLGPRHPDLANTLNNLGIVCERTGKPDDAEQYFRRAVSIARTALASDHPFVATSQKNLRDFCEARGKAVDLPAPAAEVPTAPAPAPEVPAAAPPPEITAAAPQVAARMDEQPTPAAAPARQPAINADEEDPEVTSKKFFYRVALGALGPIAMLMVVLAAGLPKLGAPELAVPLRKAAIDAPLDVAPPPVPEPVVANRVPEETGTRTTTSGDADHVTTKDITPAPAPAPMVVRASLCGDLDDWSCDPADRPVPTGPLFFLTQVKSPSATTIQHRWYQDDQLRQAVELRVQANGSAGYRTYSRNLMKSESAGRWRVEVRSRDGALLHEERFDVR